MDDFSGLNAVENRTVVQLKAELKRRGLPTNGNKNVLLKRLGTASASTESTRHSPDIQPPKRRRTYVQEPPDESIIDEMNVEQSVDYEPVTVENEPVSADYDPGTVDHFANMREAHLAGSTLNVVKKWFVKEKNNWLDTARYSPDHPYNRRQLRHNITHQYKNSPRVLLAYET